VGQLPLWPRCSDLWSWRSCSDLWSWRSSSSISGIVHRSRICAPVRGSLHDGDRDRKHVQWCRRQLSSGLWFDVSLTLPYQRPAIGHRPDIETTVCLLLVGLIVTELAARDRHHREAAADESDYVAIISGVAELRRPGHTTRNPRPEPEIPVQWRGEILGCFVLMPITARRAATTAFRCGCRR